MFAKYHENRCKSCHAGSPARCQTIHPHATVNGHEDDAMPAETHLFRCLSDNYGVLLHDPDSGATASIDAPEAAPVEAALKTTGWTLTDILVTHHHHDHTGGIAALKQKYKCRVVAP